LNRGVKGTALKLGSKGAAVKRLQTALGINADGIFGKVTRQAVTKFQTEKGLEPDGIAGAKTLAALGLSAKQPPDFKQYDPRWGGRMYSSHGDKKQTVKSSGCGPTAAADVVAAFWDEKATPVELAEFALEKGMRTYDSGTRAAFFRAIWQKYAPSAKYSHAVTSMNRLNECVTGGGLAVVCFGKRKWTKSGHYCVIYGFDGESYLINDPASASAARAKGTVSEVKAARKAFYLFWRE